MEEEIKLPFTEVIFGLPEDTKKATNYKLERLIYKKISTDYSNQYLLDRIQLRLNRINDFKDLSGLYKMDAKDIAIKLVGLKVFERYYPKDIYLSDVEYKEELDLYLNYKNGGNN